MLPSCESIVTFLRIAIKITLLDWERWNGLSSDVQINQYN